MADLYSLIVTTERLEAAYVGDLVSPEEYVHLGFLCLVTMSTRFSVSFRYSKECNKLIAQYKVLRDAVCSRIQRMRLLVVHLMLGVNAHYR